MSKPVNKTWITLTVTRIISVVLALFAVVLLIGAISLFSDASKNLKSSNTQSNISENQSHGDDTISGILEVSIGVVILCASIVIFIIASLTIFGTTWKLKKKTVAENQQSPNHIVTPTQQTHNSKDKN